MRKKEPVIISGFNQDITKMKGVEEQLRNSEERFRLVSESPFVGIAWLSPNGTILQMNETFMKMLEYPFEEIYNKHLKEFSHPDDLLNDSPYFEKMRKGELDYYHTEKRYITKNKETIWAELNVNNIKNENGETVYRIAIVQNISQRKHAEELLLESEANLRNILENTDTAYVLLDTDTNVISFNSIANELSYASTGLLLSEGKSYLEFMHEDRKSEVLSSINTVIEKSTQLSYLIYSKQQQASDKCLFVSMHPVFDKNQKVIGLSVAATDITERKNIEEEIKQINERYELAIKATNDVIWDWDVETNKIVRSENYKKIFGYGPTAENVFF